MPYPIPIPATSVYAGDAVVIAAFTLKEDTVPVNFTTWTLECQWRTRAGSSEFIPLAIDLTDAATGRLIISATAEQTREMAQSGVWDLQGTQGSTPRTFVRGSTVYTGDVTRSA